MARHPDNFPRSGLHFVRLSQTICTTFLAVDLPGNSVHNLTRGRITPFSGCWWPSLSGPSLIPSAFRIILPNEDIPPSLRLLTVHTYDIKVQNIWISNPSTDLVLRASPVWTPIAQFLVHSNMIVVRDTHACSAGSNCSHWQVVRASEPRSCLSSSRKLGACDGTRNIGHGAAS